MISRFIQILSFLICISTYTYSQTSASFYVKLKNEADVVQMLQSFKIRFQNAEITQPFARNTFEGLNLIIRLDGNDLSIDEIKSAISVQYEYIENVPIAKIAYTPNDLGVEFGSPNQWYLHKTEAQGAWELSKGSSDVTIAVVDNAFLADHPDLSNKFEINTNEIPSDGIDNDNNGFIDDYAGWNARSNTGNVFGGSTNSTHGTHVAGIAGAETDNNIGISSLSFLSRLLLVKAADVNDNITHGYEGISFAAERGAKVINCSWGSFDSSATAKSVINFALSKNCFVVASAGNFANEVPVFPATYQGVISVAATTQSDVKLNTSNFGPRINISAPGSGIWSTTTTETGASSYGFLSGTSMASPLTGALLSLMSGFAPAGNDSVILHCLYSTAVDLYNIPANNAYDSLLGAGRIHAQNAMICLDQTLQLDISENENQVSIGVFPNPTQDVFYMMSIDENLISNDVFWNIKDLSGKEILRGNGISGNINSLSRGIYFLTIESEQNNISQTVKLIKE